MKIKAVFLDIDDTITDTRSLYDEAIDICSEVFNKATGLNYSKKKFVDLYMRARAETKALVPTSAAKHNRAIYFQRLIENLDIQTDFDIIHQLYETYYNHIYNNMNLFPGTEELMKWLKETKRTIVAVSDGNTHVRVRKIHALGVSKYIDFLVSSEEVGIEKPSNQPFLVAMHKANVKPKDVVMIGNKASTDILGAERIDPEMTSIQVIIGGNKDDLPKDKEEEPDYSVDDMSKIKGIIEKIEKSKK